MEAFMVSLGVIFLAEFGDKTQVMALVLATRYRVVPVVSGLLAANLTTQGLSVAAGVTLERFLTDLLLTWIAGLIFLGFGIYVLVAGDNEDDPEETELEAKVTTGFWGASGMTYGLIVVSELGDKSMFATMALATRYGAIGTWLGSTVGMTLGGLIGVVAGAWMGYKLSDRWTRYLSAAVFLGFGLLIFLQHYAF